jgi:hypothetical protein
MRDRPVAESNSKLRKRVENNINMGLCKRVMRMIDGSCVQFQLYENTKGFKEIQSRAVRIGYVMFKFNV